MPQVCPGYLKGIKSDTMKKLVTGGAGFIASNLVDKLISHEHDVVIVDNLSTGKKENINPKVTLQEGIKLTTNFYKNRR